VGVGTAWITITIIRLWILRTVQHPGDIGSGLCGFPVDPAIGIDF